MHFLVKGNPIVSALAATTLVAYLLLTFYIVSEPSIVNGQASDTAQVVVTQEIQGEIAITVASSTMQMDGAIAGVTGGSSRATTTLNVIANNATGFNLTIDFTDAVAMQQEGGAGTIANYNPSGTSDYDMDIGTTGQDHAFAYTISGYKTDIDPVFKHTATTCGAGTVSEVGKCWYNVADATNSITLIDRATSTLASGATSTLNFQVAVGANSGLETGFYTATSTLTATEN